MITARKAKDRFHSTIDWLDSWHSFSFGEHYDDEHMGFGPLRVINEDVVREGAGFPTHGHRDMEIITVVLEGALQHKDNTGGGSVIKPYDVQKMSAGSGITAQRVQRLAQRARASVADLENAGRAQRQAGLCAQHHFAPGDDAR